MALDVDVEESENMEDLGEFVLRQWLFDLWCAMSLLCSVAVLRTDTAYLRRKFDYAQGIYCRETRGGIIMKLLAIDCQYAFELEHRLAHRLSMLLHTIDCRLEVNHE